MRLLGIDFGERRIGLAYSEGLLPSPLMVFTVKTAKEATEKVAEVCERLHIQKVVLGLSHGKLDGAARTFGQRLIKRINVSVAFVDETFTSKEAVRKMVEGRTTRKKRRKMEDAVAATIILNTYLESQK